MEPAPDLVAFCEREHPRLVGTLTLYCGDRWMAEELAHDALVAVCERWEQVCRMDSPSAWTYRVAINAARSRFRRRAAERKARARLEGIQPSTAPSADTADAVAIRSAVAALPDRQAEALVLRYYLDLSVRDAAVWMGTTEAGIKSLTRRAVHGLRSQLGGDTPRDHLEVDHVPK